MKGIKFKVVIAGKEYVRTTDRFVLISDGKFASYKIQIDDSMFTPGECIPFNRKTLILNECDVRRELIEGLFEGDIATFTYANKTMRGVAGFSEKYGFIFFEADGGLKYPLHKVSDVMPVGSSLIGTMEIPVKIAAAEKETDCQENSIEADASIASDASSLTACICGIRERDGSVGAGYIIINNDGQTALEERSVAGSFASEYDANLTAIIDAVNRASALGAKSLSVRTCCQPAVYGITTWSKKWIENDWKKDDGEEVKYADLWKNLLSCIEEAEKNMKITFEWIARDSADFWDKKASDVATKAAHTSTA